MFCFVGFFLGGEGGGGGGGHKSEMFYKFHTPLTYLHKLF